MTKEDSLRPPRLATWLLEQFSPVLQNAALEGDLIEASKQGRSSGWYWRQVFVAILLGVPNFLRKQFGGLAYAACCSGAIAAAYASFWSLNVGHVASQLSVLHEKGDGLQWPWSSVYFMAFDTAVPTAFQCATVAAALSVYLGLFHSLTPRNLVRALPVIIVALASGNAVWAFLGDIFFLGMRVMWWAPFSAVTLVALLLGMWKSNLGGTLRSTSA